MSGGSGKVFTKSGGAGSGSIASNNSSFASTTSSSVVGAEKQQQQGGRGRALTGGPPHYKSYYGGGGGGYQAQQQQQQQPSYFDRQRYFKGSRRLGDENRDPNASFREQGGFRFGREYKTNFYSAKPFVQRKTLLDTFIDRDDQYWQNRVTIKIDVPFTDHSHIIGRQGRNTQRVMQETGCHIHFPDSNKNQEMEKSNQVSIAGPIRTVEEARRRIRDLAPLTVTFELKNLKEGVNPIDLQNHPALETMAGADDLTVLVRHNRSSGQPFALVRGSVHQEAQVIQAVAILQRHLFHPNVTVNCSTSLEILQPQQTMVLGPGNQNITVISNQTGATIHYPRGAQTGATTFFLSGSLKSIIDARRQIIGLLPVVMMFDVKQPMTISDAEIGRLEAELNVSVSYKRKTEQPSEEHYSFMVRSQEYNATKVYAVRARILGETTQPVVCTEYDSNYYNAVTTGAAAAAAFACPSIATANGVPAATGSGPPPVLFSHNPVPATVAHQPPPGVFIASLAQMLTAGMGNVPPMPVGAIPASSLMASPAAAANGIVPPMNTPASAARPRESSPLEEGGSAEAPPAPARSANDPEPAQSPIAAAVLSSAHQINGDAAPKRASGRAVGSQLRKKFVDLELERAAANERVKNHPVGVRVPNDDFSGMGFSQSMGVIGLRSLLPDEPSSKELEVYCQQQQQQAAGTLTQEEQNELRDKLTELANTFSNSWLDHQSRPLLFNWPGNKFQRSDIFSSAGGGLTEPNYGETAAGGGADWKTCEDLPMFLISKGFSQLVDIFNQQEIDMESFLTLTEEDLKTIGITIFGTRRKLMKAIVELRELRKIP